MNSKINLIDIAGDDEFLKEIVYAGIEHGVVDQGGILQAKSKSLSSFTASLAKKMHQQDQINNETISFKVDGEKVKLGNVKLDIFRQIEHSVMTIVDVNFHQQKAAGLKMNREDYIGNADIGLRAGSFEVSVTLPTIKGSEIGDKINSFANDAINNSTSLNTEQFMIPIVESLSKLLEFPEIDYLKIAKGSFKELENAPQIKKEKKQKLFDFVDKNSKKELKKESDEFDKKVIIFETNSHLKTFEGIDQEKKKYKFKCSEEIDVKSWFNVLTKQVKSLEDTSEKNYISVHGKYDQKQKRIIVDSVSI